MITLYDKRHYENVATIFARWVLANPSNEQYHRAQTIREMARDFADLFAADNPPNCNVCRAPKGETALC
ncbi:hypothetical protein LCGC14_1720560, partial [marine sediment metagenome]